MTKQQFLQERQRCLAHQDRDWQQVREFLLNATEPDKPEFHFYRYLKDADLEADLRLWLDDFKQSELATHDFLVLRRFALRRYAFGLAKEISERIPSEERTALWLAKDLLLLRIGLATLVGYAVLLGAGGALAWLYQISRHWTAWLLLPAVLAGVFLLIYLNVRECAGRISGAARRAGTVWLGSLLWVTLFVLTTRVLSVPAREHFEWLHASMCGAVAVLLAILGEFFFQPGTSIAEPL
jgi:hypothetical protein